MSSAHYQGSTYPPVDTAVFALALQRYVLARSRWGERVTELAAAQVVELARTMGLNPDHQLSAIGFQVTNALVGPLRRDALLSAIRAVREHQRAAMVYALYSQCGHLTVGQLERRGQALYSQLHSCE